MKSKHVYKMGKGMSEWYVYRLEGHKTGLGRVIDVERGYDWTWKGHSCAEGL